MKDSYMQRKEDVVRNWYIVDADGMTLGRLATKVAHVLRGKHKPTFTPHIDGGDFVIVINASKINLTGDKLDKKIYYNHSGYTGGLRERTARVMKENYPVEMIERAIKGMLPKGRLGRQMYKKLFVYADQEHPHQAQQPVEMKVN
ncbi:MAG: 50S ribosomal protein L13 [Bacilli bacterium]|nr:50S ribosomal protein L13 [Bacilli bacterium]MDD4809044.1 50S ribosomal protein L13 [Bacilli bacterium]